MEDARLNKSISALIETSQAKINMESLTFTWEFIDSQLTGDFRVTMRLFFQRFEDKTQKERQRRISNR